MEDLVLSCRSNVEFVLRSMLEDQLADVTAAQETGRRRAEQGVPLPYVMAAFRVGFSRIWANLVEQARRQDLVSSDALVDAASDIWAVHDTFAEAMAAAHPPCGTNVSDRRWSPPCSMGACWKTQPCGTSSTCCGSPGAGRSW